MGDPELLCPFFDPTITTAFSYLVYASEKQYLGYSTHYSEVRYTSPTIDGVLNAINDESDNQGATVYIQAGSHPVDAPIRNLGEMHYLGAGSVGGTILFDASVNGLARMIDARGDSNVELSHLLLNGRGKACRAIDLSHDISTVTRTHLHDLVVRGANDLLTATNNEDWQLSQSTLLEYGRYALLVESTSGQGTVQRTLFTHNTRQGTATIRLDEGKIDFDRCALEGNSSAEPSFAIIELAGNVRCSFAQSWLYAERCPLVRVSSDIGGQPSLDLAQCELYLRPSSTVDAAITARTPFDRLVFSGGSLINSGSGKALLDGPANYLGLFGTRVNRRFNQRQIGELVDFAYFDPPAEQPAGQPP